VVNPGEPDALIEVVCAVNVALCIDMVEMPVDVAVASPTDIVLITPVVAIPTVGTKSIFKLEPKMRCSLSSININKKAEKNGCYRVTLFCREGLIPFYEKAGYEVNNVVMKQWFEIKKI